MEARRNPALAVTVSPEDTLPSWPEPRFESAAPGSGTRLASERPTLPPPRAEADDVMVSHIHLGPSVDEVLYRLSLGDLSGASLANEELEPCTPLRVAPLVVVDVMGLSYLEQYLLAMVDGHASWGDILDASPFAPRDTLQALCELVDKGVVALASPSLGSPAASQ